MRFSEKKGFTTIRKVIQKDDIDSALRNKLWNLVQSSIFNRHQTDSMYDTAVQSNLSDFFLLLWNNFFAAPIDTIPDSFGKAVSKIREQYYLWPWFKVYDFIEFVAQTKIQVLNSDSFQKACNSVLAEEKAGYRFLKAEIVEITAEEELRAIESAIDNTSRFVGVRTHLNTAIKHLADRQNPDFRNSIKESISAVESLCIEITNLPKATLGNALAELEKNGKIHGALKASFSSLYGYTSDSNGIRHAILEESRLTIVDAQFMLVSCSSFINYVIGKLSENGRG